MEIERKYLLKDDSWRLAVEKTSLMRQGYLAGSEKGSVRIRFEDDQASLNIKSATLGISRLEYEYAIPSKDAQEILDQLCNKPLIEKHRHYLKYAGSVWEIDEFLGDNAGLIVAEIELPTPEFAPELPRWLGREVSQEPRFYNVSLVKYPFSQWSEEERQ